MLPYVENYFFRLKSQKCSLIQVVGQNDRGKGALNIFQDMKMENGENTD